MHILKLGDISPGPFGDLQPGWQLVYWNERDFGLVWSADKEFGERWLDVLGT